MRKLALMIFAAWVLGACSPAAPSPTATPTAEQSLSTPVLPATTGPAEIAGRSPGTELSTAIDGPPMSGCTLQSLLREADEEEVSLFPPVTETDWRSGPDTAATTIVEYADFQCPFCGRLAPVLAQLKADYPDDVRVVFRHFPLVTNHDKAALASIAAEAAGAQGRFWEMHDLLFARQTEWAAMGPDAFKIWVTDRAVELGLNVVQFDADLESPALAGLAQTAYEEAIAAGVPGTPFLLINGRIYSGPTDYDNLSVIVRLYKLQERQYRSCPPMIIDPARAYLATIVTEYGEIVFELFPANAPRAVNNFVFLALDGFYDGVTFHRVFPGYIAQTGDPSGTGFGGSGYAFVREDGGLLFDAAGTVALDSEANGSQFFITYSPLPTLDGSYTIFGRVIEGFEVLEALNSRDPNDGVNQPLGDLILTILIEER
ncbi:MAG TPA: peptidylprolyl isomerase [Anaerolineales bacterium]|nr:peptidylprolyl isomerase [Anaerolineales bacterium]